MWQDIMEEVVEALKRCWVLSLLLLDYVFHSTKNIDVKNVNTSLAVMWSLLNTYAAPQFAISSFSACAIQLSLKS